MSNSGSHPEEAEMAFGGVRSFHNPSWPVSPPKSGPGFYTALGRTVSKEEYFPKALVE